MQRAPHLVIKHISGLTIVGTLSPLVVGVETPVAAVTHTAGFTKK